MKLLLNILLIGVTIATGIFAFITKDLGSFIALGLMAIAVAMGGDE